MPERHDLPQPNMPESKVVRSLMNQSERAYGLPASPNDANFIRHLDRGGQ